MAGKICPKCSGQDVFGIDAIGGYGKGYIKCKRCNGKGTVRYKGEDQQCNECQGQGTVTCPRCNGSGRIGE